MAKKSGVCIEGKGKYRQVPLEAIHPVKRPPHGKEETQLFFNPRAEGKFTPEKLAGLLFSIRVDGLQHPLTVRAVTKNGVVEQIDLIAGERRLHCCRQIYKDDLPCLSDGKRPSIYKSGEIVVHKGRIGTVVSQKGETVAINFEDGEKVCLYEDCDPTISGKKLYEKICCNVIFDCNDERALRVAYSENAKGEPLTIKEEVDLVERLEKMGKKQDEIADMLTQNVTWVSQTANFSRQLPKAAFDKLMVGEMARNVAVDLLSYKLEDRHALYSAAVQIEQVKTDEKIVAHEDETFIHEDEQEMHLAEAVKAASEGDVVAADKAKKKAAVAATKASKAAKRLKRAQNEKGRVKQGHIKQAAAETGLVPRKAKILERDEIEEFYVKGTMEFLTGKNEDPVTGNLIPNEYVCIVRRTAQAILNGVRDPLAPIREYMISNDQWEEPVAVGAGKKSKADVLDDISDDDFDDMETDFDPDDFSDD